MTEIKVSEELNLTVAKAIGMTWYGTRTIMEAWWYRDGNRCRRKLPSFSEDLNDAFMAAEETELFNPRENTFGQGPWVSLARGPLRWIVMADRTCIGRGDTPALAICAAILKLFEEKESPHVFS